MTNKKDDSGERLEADGAKALRDGGAGGLVDGLDGEQVLQPLFAGGAVGGDAGGGEGEGGEADEGAAIDRAAIHRGLRHAQQGMPERGGMSNCGVGPLEVAGCKDD